MLRRRSEMKSLLWILLPGSVFLLLTTTVLLGEGTAPAAGEEIDWQVISSGGTEGTSENFQMMGTAGQTATGFAGSTNFKVSHGYWYGSVFGASYVCGDADGNGIVNISDAVYLISYIFGGGSAPDPYLSGDADCNQIVNISDAVYLIAYIFGGGPAPCASCK
jgi:hypothetical protein